MTPQLLCPNCGELARFKYHEADWTEPCTAEWYSCTNCGAPATAKEWQPAEQSPRMAVRSERHQVTEAA